MFGDVVSEFFGQYQHQFGVCFDDYCYASDFYVDCLDFDVDCVGVDYLLYLVGRYFAVISVVFLTMLADCSVLLNVKVIQPMQTAFLTRS